ncbi:hypothetical protein QBC44DRAFT_112807 [Cladorrhinum sp. PSN332]|nr:hypothetical protein QBC44DRAFT_112807 [Cladorrhinum sp. PSN332]
MADQCIVCLENLDVETNPDALSPAQQQLLKKLQDEHGRLALDDPEALSELNKKNTSSPLDTNNNHVAQILICGHMLHDACLKEWSEKANSCPICRQTFHVVTVFDKVGGQYLSTRRVEDKKQVAEFDPQLINYTEEDFEEEDAPCPVCDSAGHKEVLLICDGCETCYHTFCIGLDRVPDGPWFCMECVHSFGPEIAQPADNNPGSQSHGIAGQRYFFPRTQASMRRARQRARSDEWQGAWGRITGQIWNALELDLDYQDDDDPSVFEGLRRSQQMRERERQEHERWQQRLNIASRLGAREVFASNMPGLRARPQPPPPPPPETREEQLAWGALERARDTESRKRKSRSGTAEPNDEPTHEPERKLKRPRTRRITTTQSNELPSIASTNGHNPEASSSSAARPRPPPVATPTAEAAPTFLSSLLKEVEMSTPLDEENLRSIYGPIPGANDVSSPVRSPSPQSPGSITPPPGRSSSPHMTLSSHIAPIYPPANYSPTRASSSSSIKPSRSISPNKHAPLRDGRSSPENGDSELRGRRHQHRNAYNHGPLELRQPQPRRTTTVLARSANTSPTRHSLPMEMKQNINRIVKTALSPHWHSNQLTPEQYEAINRDISRKIYEEVKDPAAVGEETRQNWEKVASQEVARAVASLKA